MHKANFARSWRVLMVVCAVAMCSLAPLHADTGDSGVNVTAKKVRFSDFVRTLASANNMNLVMLTTVDDEIGEVNISTQTPVDKIIADLSKSVGVDFWKDGDTYYIGKHQDVQVTPKEPLVDNNLPKLTVPTNMNAVPASNNFSNNSADDNQPPARESTKYITRKIDLQYFSVVELLYALGAQGQSLGGNGTVDDSRIKNRIESVFNPNKRFNIVAADPDKTQGPSAPWLNEFMNNNTTGRNGAGDANQIGNPRGGLGGATPGGGFGNANRTGTGGVTPAAAGTTPGTAKTLGTGPLTPFVPTGVVNVIGLNGLNALLVRAKTEEDIDELDQLIKLLDQPVKQVIVEAMIVKMDVKDAFALGVSWTFAGMPLSIISSNGGGEGNFSLRYLKGNLRVALATTLTTSHSRIVQAPRVIVQNGGSGQIAITDEVPFITVDSSEDVFGRTTATPNISFQQFRQGLAVANVLIHPDDTVTMEVAPIIELPTASVGIPGQSGGGGVSGSNGFELDQVVRVKDGETIMLGGFSTKDEEQGGMRAPLLSNLPVIGPLLFRNKTRSSSDVETLVFVTPTIMKEDTTNFDGMKSLPPLF